MLNKKKVAIVIVIAVIIILIIFLSARNNGASVSKTYNNLVKSSEYLFNMKNDNNYEIAIAKKENQTCIDMNNNNERTTTLMKDDVTYLISHPQKEYYVYSSDIAEGTVVTDMLQDLQEMQTTEGKEKINGKKYKYEEYSGFAGFMTSTSMDVDENNVKTRFYFDGNDLVYIKTIIAEGEEELLEVKISYSAPEELFEIPSDYAEAEY